MNRTTLYTLIAVVFALIGYTYFVYQAGATNERNKILSLPIKADTTHRRDTLDTRPPASGTNEGIPLDTGPVLTRPLLTSTISPLLDSLHNELWTRDSIIAELMRERTTTIDKYDTQVDVKYTPANHAFTWTMWPPPDIIQYTEVDRLRNVPVPDGGDFWLHLSGGNRGSADVMLGFKAVGLGVGRLPDNQIEARLGLQLRF
jgi:hypothetical protein